MTTPASPPELCPDCGRSPVAEGYSRSVSRCDNVYGDGQCQALTITRLRLEVATLQIALGKAQGALEGLRAGWSVSNHDAWEQGNNAPHARNPFPKPEKKETK